jgi:hypothetical protein
VYFPVREPESDFLFLNQHSSPGECIDVLCYLNLRSFSEITPYACWKLTEEVYFRSVIGRAQYGYSPNCRAAP